MPFHHKKLSTFCALSLCFMAPPVLAQDVTVGLPSEIRALLQQEMVQVDAAMKAIHGAIVRGDHEVVATKGQAIHDSFILKKSMTPGERKTLKAAVPKEFLELDQEFHQLAADLSGGGDNRNTAEQMRSFAQMTQACVTCHSRYVSARFNGLER